MKLIFFILILTLASCASNIAPSPDSIVIDDFNLQSPPAHIEKKESPQSEPAAIHNDLYDGVKKSVWDDLARF